MLANELPILILVAFGLAVVIKTFFVQAFFIPSASMTTTLIGAQCHQDDSLRCTGDRVLINKLVYDFRAPRRGEVVVFTGQGNGFAAAAENAPAITSSSPIVNGIRRARSAPGLGGGSGEVDFIKRVIAVGGDTLG